MAVNAVRSLPEDGHGYGFESRSVTYPMKTKMLLLLLVVSVFVSFVGVEGQLSPEVRGERVVSGSEQRSVLRTTYSDETDYRNARPDQLVREVIKITIEAQESNYTFGIRETFGPPPRPTTRRPTTTATTRKSTTTRPTTKLTTTTTMTRPPPPSDPWLVFDGRKWFLFDLSRLPDGYGGRRSIREMFNVNFVTNQPDGLIWFVGNDRDNMHLTLKNGILYLTVTHGGIEDRTARVQSSHRLDDNQPHNITISRNDRRILVDIDGTKTVKYLSYDADIVSTNNVIYLGGSEDTYELTQSHTSYNFNGTVRHAMVTGDSLPDDLDLIDMTLIRPMPVYVVINGERDRDREFFMSTRGTTRRPMVDHDLSTVTFTTGLTYLQLPAWSASRNGTVELYFKTIQPDGLLLVSNPRTDRKDFFAVELFDGIVYVLFNLGGKTQRFQLGSGGINDGRPHHLRIERNGRTLWLTLDNEQQQELLDTASGGDGLLDLGSAMFVAGSAFPSSVPWEIISRRAEFFRGCVWGLSFNGEPPVELGRVRQEQRVPGIELGCTTMPAECSSETPACDHGECHERWDGRVCDCSRTTYTGDRCQNDAPLVAFRGADFVRIQMRPTAVTHTNDVSVHFRTSKDNGILFQTSNRQNSDYLKASLDRGQIKLETFIDAIGLPTVLNVYCDRPVSDNQWHTLYIKRRAGDMEAHIDNCRPAGVQLPGEGFTLDIDEILVGKSNIDEPQQTTFIGNMRNFYFNDHRLFDQFQSGELVDITPSTRSPPVTRQPPVVIPVPTEPVELDLLPTYPVTFLSTLNHYVQLSPVPFTQDTRIRFLLRTSDRNGLVLYRPGDNMLAVELVNGRLRVVTDEGLGPNMLFPEGRGPLLADGQWHEFDLVRTGADRFVMRVDGADVGTGLRYRSDSSATTSEPLYIAGVPGNHLSRLPASVTSRKGFGGCLASVNVNGRQYDLQRIAPFLTPGCADVSSVIYCRDNLCQHRGVCLESINTYVCNCNLTSFAGEHCEDEAEGYLFSEHLKPGIVVYTLNPPQDTNVDRIAFGFMTWQPNGTILRADSGIVDFIEARLENGYLVFNYDMGDSEQRIVETRRRVNDGQYHYATLVRHGSNVTVHVDDLPVRHRTHDPAAILFNNLAAVKIGGNLNRESKIIDHFDGIIAGVYVNGYRVMDMATYERDSHVTIDGDATIADHPFRLPVRIPPQVTRKPGEIDVIPGPGPEEPGVVPPVEPGEEVVPGPGPGPIDNGDGGGVGVVGGGGGGEDSIDVPIAAASVLGGGSGAEAGSARAAAVAGAMLGVLAAVSSVMWAVYKFKPGLIGAGGGARPMVISSPQTPLLAAGVSDGAGGASGGGGGGAARSTAIAVGSSSGAGGGSGAAGSVSVTSGAGSQAGSGRSAYERGYGVFQSQITTTTISGGSGDGSAAAGAAGAASSASAAGAGSTSTMHRGIQTDFVDGGPAGNFTLGSGGGVGSSTFVQSTLVKNVYSSSQQAAGAGGAASGYGGGSSAGYGAGYTESASAGGFTAGSGSSAVAAYDFSSSGLDSTASAQGFGTLQQAPLSSDAMLTSASSFTYERGVNIVQSNGYVSSMYDATMSTSGGSATGADTSAAFQMHNMPLHMASGYGGGGAIHAASTVQQLQASSPTAVTPNLMTAAEQIRVDCVQLTTNGRYVVTGSIYGPPQVWDMKNGELVKMMSGEELSSTDLHLANGDTLLIGQVAEVETVDAADIDSAANRPPHRKLQIWDFDSGRPLEMRKNESCTASCMMSDGERMVLARNEHYGGTGTTVIIWDVLGNEPVRRLGCNSPVSAGDNVTYVGVSRDSRYVVAGYQGTADGQAYFIIFDLSEHDVTAPKLLTLPAAVEVTAILENHEAVTGTLAGELVVWSLRTGKPLRHLVSTSTASAMAHGGSTKAHLREVKDLAVSKDVALLVSASADSTLGIWSLETDKLMTVLNGHRDEVWCCALSNDNELVVSGSRDHTIRLWRVTDGIAVAAIDAGVDIFRVLISNNKRTVVALADKFSTRKLIMLQIVRSKTKSSSSSRSTLH